MNEAAPTPPPPSAGRLVPARAPPTILWAYRALFVMVMGAYFTIAYESLRAVQGSFGFTIGQVARAIPPALALGIFLVPLVLLVELPEMVLLRGIPNRRRRRGLCPGCGYPRALDDHACPECESDGFVRPAIRPTLATLRRFGAMLLLALLLGAAVGETLMQLDEARFRSEVRARPPIVLLGGTPSPDDLIFQRRRQWPGSFSWLWGTRNGQFFATSPAIDAPR
ncbi:MAG: hypothetical protein FJ253_06910 [Phycisphaerae bacterium]|nr:hypothetical protein [Phycisphaerae bacterium]